MMITQERLNEIEQELLKIQHELQAAVRPVNSDNNVLLKNALLHNEEVAGSSQVLTTKKINLKNRMDLIY